MLLMRCKYLGEMSCSSPHLLQEVAFRTGSFRSVRGSSALYTQWASTSWQTGAFAGDCGRQRHRKHHAVSASVHERVAKRDAEAAELGSYLLQISARSSRACKYSGQSGDSGLIATTESRSMYCNYPGVDQQGRYAKSMVCG